MKKRWMFRVAVRLIRKKLFRNEILKNPGRWRKFFKEIFFVGGIFSAARTMISLILFMENYHYKPQLCVSIQVSDPGASL
jgi:hypothetical protein